MLGIPMVDIASGVQTVHTTGVNWSSVVTITSAVVVLMTAVLGLTAKYISSRITSSIDRFRIDVVSKLDTRLIQVETKLDNISTNNPKRGL